MAISEKVLRAVNDEPPLQSMLYDLNMLPEQIETSEDESALALAVAFYMMGKGCWNAWVSGHKSEPKT